MATKKGRTDIVPPGQRAVQRDSRAQLEEDPYPARPDEPTAWERELQERLPPRGEGSQHNQGADRQEETVRDVAADERVPEPIVDAQIGRPRSIG